ncbi:MAG: hypothetical protein QM639_14835 [Rhodocyclaceae bacterium]
MTKTGHAPIRRDWVSKTLAGGLLGLCIAMAASAVFAHLASSLPLPTRGQLVMWMVPPLWLGIFGGVYFFASGLRAWLWLGGASLALWGLVLALRSIG